MKPVQPRIRLVLKMASVFRWTSRLRCSFKGTSVNAFRWVTGIGDGNLLKATEKDVEESLESRKRKFIRKSRNDVLRAARRSLEREKLARRNQLEVPVNEVRNDWMHREGLLQIENLAEFYGIFRDLNEGKKFKSDNIMHVKFNDDQVYYGNFLKPAQCQDAPNVTFGTQRIPYHSILFLNLDGSLFESSKEVLHWFVGNMSNGVTADGEHTVPYTPPLPWKGSGFHRFCFLLLAHSEPIDTSTLKRPNRSSLLTTSFCTKEFLSEQPSVSPVGVSWFQAQWDDSVTKYCSQTLGISEPVFELETFIPPKEKARLEKQEYLRNKFRNK